MKKATSIYLICSLLILLFGYTGLSKLQDHSRFQEMLRHSPLLTAVAAPLSFLLPISELLLCFLLGVPWLQKTGLWISAFLLSCFSAYLLFMLIFYTKLPCACGGVIGALNWPQHVGFNVIFLALTVTALHHKRNLDAPPDLKRGAFRTDLLQ